jgi:hypothetical protein
MPKLPLVAFCGLFCLTGRAQAELRVAEPTVNLGEIRGGAPLQVNFTLVNTGPEAVDIVEVNRGCGCLAPRLDKRLLGAGEKTRLQMEVRTLGHPNGPHTWTAAIRYRTAEGIREVPLALRAVVKNDVTVQPAVCALFVETTIRQEITLADLRMPPLKVTSAESTSHHIKVTTKNEGDGVTKIVLEASAAGLDPGRHDEILSIYTNDPLYGRLEVPVTLTRAASSAVLVSPDHVDLVAAPGEAVPSTLIRLRPRGDRAVLVEKAAADDPAVTCTWAAGPGNHATLKIQVTAPAALQTTVRVTLGEPLRETVAIPVRIRRP